MSLNSPLTPPKDTSNQVMFSRLHVWVDAVFRSGTGKSAPMGLNTNSSLRFRETAMEQASDGMSFLFFWSLKDGDKQLEPAWNFIGRSHPTYANLISRYLNMWPKTPKTWALSLQTNRAGPTQIKAKTSVLKIYNSKVSAQRVPECCWSAQVTRLIALGI